jgi:predicted Fe-Mo cluster-binding NifX family protein
MKIAVSAAGNTLDTPVDPRFGRCANFLIVDTDNLTFEAFGNEAGALGGGAGIQAAQFVASKGVSGVVTGNVGPNAMRTLSAAGVKVYTGATGSVADAVKAFNDGKLSGTNGATVEDHYGMQGGGMGGGRGQGRGMGGGTGRGQGRGMGGGMGGGRGQGRGGAGR